MSTVDVIASGAPFEDAFDWILWSIYAGAIGFNGYLIYLLHRRKNWARLLLLVMTVAIVIASAVWPPDLNSDPAWSIVLLTACTVADVVAMAILFTGPGHAWFKGVHV